MDHNMIANFYDRNELPCREKRDWMIVFVKFRGIMLRYASEKLQDDFEIVKLAVINFGNSIEFSSPRLRDNEEIVSIAINNTPSSIRFASERLRNDLTIAKSAISKCGTVIQYVSVELKNNLEIVETALDHNIASMRYIPNDMIKQVALKYIKKDRSCIRYIPTSLLPDRSLY